MMEWWHHQACHRMSTPEEHDLRRCALAEPGWPKNEEPKIEVCSRRHRKPDCAGSAVQVYCQSANSSNFASPRPVHSQFSETQATHHNTKASAIVAVVLSECSCVQWPHRDHLLYYVRRLNRSVPSLSVRWWVSCLDLAELLGCGWAAF